MKRFLLLLLALSLAIPSGTLAQSGKRNSKKQKKSVTQLKKELGSLRNKKSEIRKELRTTKRSQKYVLADIGKVDHQLGELQGKLQTTAERLSESKAEQKTVAQKLEIANKKLAESKEQVRKRIKRMYMQGDSGFLSVLASNGDVGEISSRQYVMQRIAKKDREVFETFLALKKEVATEKQKADVLVTRVSGLLADQRDQQDSLKDARQRKGVYLKELQQKQGELQEMLAQFAQDEATITSQIQSYMRRRTKRTKNGRPISLPPYKGGRFSYPVNGRLSSNFGMRYHPILHITRMHAGCDFGAPVGTSIHAVADGEVIHASYMSGYGSVVIVDHGGGLSTVYAHCSRIVVSDGAHVRRGQYIANVGNTGLSTGPHLHFEVRVNGRAVNPRSYL